MISNQTVIQLVSSYFFQRYRASTHKFFIYFSVNDNNFTGHIVLVESSYIGYIESHNIKNSKALLKKKNVQKKHCKILKMETVAQNDARTM